MNRSAWQTIQRRRFSPLKADGHFDVVVIGAGITGLSAAYYLARAGNSVCVLERDALGDGDTGHTTAHLTAVTDLRLTKLVDSFGEDGARLVWQAGETAIEAIDGIIRDYGIQADFRRVNGYLHASLLGQDDESNALRKEAELAARLGIAAQYVNEVPFVGKPGIEFANQAKFQPLAYLAGLADLIADAGGVIHQQTEVTAVEASPRAVKAGKHRIECDYLVIATHVPMMGIADLPSASLLQSELVSYSTYAIAASLPSADRSEVCLWDTSSPYYYLRLDHGQRRDRVIFGGEDHKTGQTADTAACYEKLESVLAGIFPQARVYRYWSGQVVETHDGLPLIGETAERQFAATGFAGNGITFGTLAGMMARDRCLGRNNPWQNLFAIDRKTAKGGTWQYLKDNADFGYYYLKDRVAVEGVTVADVDRNEGKILTVDGKRVACSRDEHGQLSMVEAECTHLGCVVHWNCAEQTWDCPCHGSRFHPNGEVLAGPAEQPLAPVKAKRVAKAKKAAAEASNSSDKRSPAERSTNDSPKHGRSQKPRRQDSAGQSKDR